MSSLVVQWLRIHLAMQGMWVQSHIWGTEISASMEQLSLRQTTDPAHHNQRACALQQKIPHNATNTLRSQINK